MKRILASLLLLGTLFLLCACPGGAPVEPPAGNPCPTCGKDPCVCPADDPCPDCGNDPCTCPTGEVCPDCGNDPCTCPSDGGDGDGGEEIPVDNTTVKPEDADLSLVFGDGAAIEGTGHNLGDFSGNKTETGEFTAISGRTYEDIDFLARVTVPAGATGVTFINCRFVSLENRGTDTALLDSYVVFSGVGVLNSGRGLFVENCLFSGTGTAISSTGDELQVRQSGISTSADGIGVEIRDSENSLVALSVIRGTQKSVVLTDVFNTVVVRNSLTCAHTVGGKNVYVCDNAMGGRIFSENNNYFLADGNTYPADGLDHRAVAAGNENTNGDTLTDVNARLSAGVNERLLPHINKDQFVGMERKTTVKDYSNARGKSVYAYVSHVAERAPYVILAPGAYATEETLALSEKHSNTTLYAYGVYVEGVAYPDKNNTTPHITTDGTADFAFKGLTFGYAQPSNGQLYVLKKLTDNKVLVIAGAGYLNDFANLSGTPFFKSTSKEFGLQRAGTDYGLGEYFFSGIEKNADGTMTVTLNAATYDVLKKGDVLTCRYDGQTNVVSTHKSTNISYIDVTQYGHARGFAFTEYKNNNAVTYLRMADIRKSGPVIDEDTYMAYAMLQEEYGVDLEISYDELEDGNIRYRGAPAHVSSVDAIHNSSSVQGSRVISCLFDGMCDDATNQKSAHARLSEVFDNGDGTATIVYKGNLSQNTFNQKGAASNFTGCCVHFQKGDRVYIYTYDGQLVCDTPALSDMVAYTSVMSNCEGVTQKSIARYKITVAADAVNYKALEGYDLTDDSYLPDEKVPVDNLSYASYGFFFDNCLIQNGEKSGARVKASGGTFQNCTIRNMAKTATAMVYEIYWGESGIARDYTFKNNVIENIGYAKYNATLLDEDSLQYRYTAICIIGLGGSVVDEAHMLFKNILIEGNKFVDRCLENYNVAIYAHGAGNVTIRNNDFGTAEEEDGLDKVAGVMYLHRVVNVELSGNTYSPYIPTVRDYVQGNLYANIFGDDVGDEIPDKLN